MIEIDEILELLNSMVNDCKFDMDREGMSEEGKTALKLEIATLNKVSFRVYALSIEEEEER